MVWDQDGEEETTDLVTQALFQAADTDENDKKPGVGQARKKQSKKKQDKAKKKSRKNKSPARRERQSPPVILSPMSPASPAVRLRLQRKAVKALRPHKT